MKEHSKSKFIDNSVYLKFFQVLLPGNAKPDEVKVLGNLTVHYDVHSYSAIQAEYIMWRKELNCSKLKADTEVLETLENCNDKYFPDIYQLLLILDTLLVTICSIEISFSTMKRKKIVLRNKLDHEKCKI